MHEERPRATDPGAPAARARGLGKGFRAGFLARRRPALRGLDLELARGARLALLGPNGSGKTTLLRLLAGVLEPDAGSLLVLGVDARAARPPRAVGYAPDEVLLPDDLGARHALELLARLEGEDSAGARRAAQRALERVALAADARRRLGAFSRGMKRRFSLAQAFLFERELLLLDEPTAGLDAPGLVAWEELARSALAAGSTLVVATHSPAELGGLCDEALVLVDGRAVAGGRLADLGGGPPHVEVELVDAADLPRLEAFVAEHGGRLVAGGPGRGALLRLYLEGARSADACPSS